jgi:hypothetical protein
LDRAGGIRRARIRAQGADGGTHVAGAAEAAEFYRDWATPARTTPAQPAAIRRLTAEAIGVA